MDKIKTIYIGEKDIYHWTMNEGKSILMPILFESSKKLIENNLDSIKSIRVEAIIRDKKKAFDFFVKKEELSDTLSKIMDWAIEEEEYEMCNEIKTIQQSSKIDQIKAELKKGALEVTKQRGKTEKRKTENELREEDLFEQIDDMVGGLKR